MEGGHPTFFSEKECAKMKEKIEPCLALIEKAQQSRAKLAWKQSGYDSLACQTATTFCEGALGAPWGATGRCEY